MADPAYDPFEGLGPARRLEPLWRLALAYPSLAVALAMIGTTLVAWAPHLDAPDL